MQPSCAYPFDISVRHVTMGNAFGKKKTLKEQMRENKRTMNRAIRELDRERVSLQNQEKKLVIEIKKMAKEGQMVRRTG